MVKQILTTDTYGFTHQLAFTKYDICNGKYSMVHEMVRQVRYMSKCPDNIWHLQAYKDIEQWLLQVWSCLASTEEWPGSEQDARYHWIPCIYRSLHSKCAWVFSCAMTQQWCFKKMTTKHSDTRHSKASVPGVGAEHQCRASVPGVSTGHMYGLHYSMMLTVHGNIFLIWL